MTDAGAPASIRDRLLKDRHALLDLSTRNRLVNVPLRVRNVRTIEVVDEVSAEIYRLLGEGKGLTFVPGRELGEDERAGLDAGDTETGGIPQPEADEIDEHGVARRHADLRLQTRLTSEGLQKRLFDIWYDAQTLEEEQGVNVLYLALGLLRWFDSTAEDAPARHAPLILLPVRLERTSAAEKFKLRGRGEPASPNLTLQAKMKAEFSLLIEDVQNEDELDIPAYMARVAETVAGQARWQVLPDAMVLGFFSFAKFLMYRDLDPDNWPGGAAIDQHPIVTRILRDGFPETEPLIPGQDTKIDPLIPPARMNHVVDADSSQTVVIEEAAGGRDLVVKGPPGTGKSQTITNIIAAAAAQDRKVLFVAEKMAALDVVHRRLRDAGLGPLTLELHSNKATKRSLLDELKRTKELAPQPAPGESTLITRLTEARDGLNAHAEDLHRRHDPHGLSAYQVIGRLAASRESPAQPGFVPEAAERWTPAEFEARAEIMAEIAQRLSTIGAPSAHPWRGVRREALDPTEIDDLAGRLRVLDGDLAALRQAAADGGPIFGNRTGTIGDLGSLRATLRAAAALPPCDRAALAHPAWAVDAARLADLPRRGRDHADTRAAVDGVFVDATWQTDLVPCRTAIAARGGSLFRFLDGTYRAQIGLLQSLLKTPMPKGQQARLDLVDRMIAAQAARRAFEEIKPLGPAFGTLWQDDRSAWDDLAVLAAWRAALPLAALPDGFLGRLASLPDPAVVAPPLAVLDGTLDAARARLDDLVAWLDLDLPRAFGVADAASLPLTALADRVQAWRAQPEQVTKWVAFAERGRAAARLGLGVLVDAVLDGALDATTLAPSFERAALEAVRTDIFGRLPDLKRFDGELQQRLVDGFRTLDVNRIGLARAVIAHAHRDAMPRGAAGIGPLGVLNGELAKKRNHLPIRGLLDKAGPAIQQLKPVFMMSPLSVAQYLKPGALSFDLLVIDEASQVEPIDALGAMARVRQIVVVGDERQLPPTRFFAKLTSDVEERDETDDETVAARDAESILDLCLAKGVPARMLNWHYRSRHQSLIAVSNREFYENRLFIVPSPYDAVAGMGLKFNHLPHAHYDRGNTRTNPVEAKAVVDAVIRHAVETPQKSLGVATFSVAQRQAIQKELELARRAHPEAEAFFQEARTEPFFIKNLENIQGDERDVILISVGYGRTETGYLAMAFGPLSAEGGERRLNVLISRAKERCEVFSSITGDDIDLERTKSRGVAALKLFLTYAQTGRLDVARPSGRDADSAFEQHVARALAARGHEVRAQIGTAGFFVDLAVIDPDKPGRFTLGIECDGAPYHASRSARDRDRLRQRVLEDHGWVLHRIWSLDWYLRPAEELRKVEDAIAAAQAEWRERDDSLALPARPMPIEFGFIPVDVDTEEIAVTIGATPSPSSLAIPYQEAAFAVDTRVELHEVPMSDLVRHVIQVVEAEGPVHDDEIVTRLRTLWGLGRAGTRIRDAVLRAIGLAQRQGAIAGDGFRDIPGRPLRLRDRSAVASAGLRKPDMLPPDEIAAAMLATIERNFGAGREELVTATARLFGYAATSAPLRAVLEAQIDRLAADGRVRDEAGRLVLSTTLDEVTPPKTPAA